MHTKKSTFKLACLISLFSVSAFAQAHSVEDECTQVYYHYSLFFRHPYSDSYKFKTCIPVTNGSKTPLKVTWQYYGEPETISPGYTGRALNAGTWYAGTNTTIVNLENNKVLFSGFMKNYTGLDCTDTQCTPY